MLVDDIVDDYFCEAVHKDYDGEGRVEHIDAPNVGVLAYEVDAF